MLTIKGADSVVTQVGCVSVEGWLQGPQPSCPAVCRKEAGILVEPKPHTQAALPASWFVNPAFASQGGACHGPKPNLFFGFGYAGDQFNVNSRSLTSRGTLPRLGWVVSAFDQLCYVTASQIIFLELSQGPEMFQEALSHLSRHGFPFVCYIYLRFH